MAAITLTNASCISEHDGIQQQLAELKLQSKTFSINQQKQKC